MDRVLVRFDGHVAHVRLNRPDKRNALDLEMFEALVDAGRQVRSHRPARAVVLSGEGPAFCAGLDWPSFMAMGYEGPKRLLERDPDRSPANLAQRAAWIWRELKIPVIAAVQGPCFGGGLQIALACDLRVVAPDVRMSVMEIKYGIIPDMTATRTLCRLVRPDIAKELVYTGIEVGGEEAVRIGLATRLAQNPLEMATGMAQKIAERSPHAIRAAKRLLDDSEDLDVSAALKFESELQMGLLGTPNQLEAVQALMARRDGNFQD